MKGRGPYAALFDGGRVLRVQASDRPGLDLAWYTDAHEFEESIFEYGSREKTAAQNDVVRATPPRAVRRWGEDMPGHVWIDRTNRYPWNGLDGFKMNLFHVDRVAGDFPPLPAGEVPFEYDADDPLVDRASARFIPELDHDQIQDLAEDPGEWYRLPTLNESGGTGLREPLALTVNEVRGSVALELVNNSLFDPFDMREGSRYYVTRAGYDDKVAADEADAWRFLNPRGVYRLTLRPRRWRFFIVTYAIFLHSTLFEMFYVREVFTKAFYDLPPCYPLRHNILHADAIGGDAAVFWQWEHSLAAGELQQEIFDANYHTLSEVHAFSYIELTQMWIQRAPPRADEIVLGIERLDCGGRDSSSVWIHNRRDQTAAYPLEQIAFFQEVPWYILPPGA